MKKIITSIGIIVLAAIGMFSLSALVPAPATFADTDVCSNQNIPKEVKEAYGCGGSSTTKDSLANTVRNILNVVIGLSGLIAVIFIIIGGYQYMTSTGDSAKTAKAMNTIKYAIVGLIVVIFSFAIANFAIDNIIKAQNNSGSSQSTTNNNS